MAGVLGLLLGDLFAQRRGITDPAARNRIRVLGLVAPPGLATPVLLVAAADREAAAAPPPAVQPAGAVVAGPALPPAPAPQPPALPPGPPPAPPPTQAQVPDLTPYDYPNAAEVVTDLQLVPVEVPTYSTAARGTVIGQSPDAGTVLPIGQPVNIYTSQGLQVPNVVTLMADKAEERLRPSFEVTHTVDQKAHGAPGTVVAQNPPAGATADQGDTVEIFVVPLATRTQTYGITRTRGPGGRFTRGPQSSAAGGGRGSSGSGSSGAEAGTTTSDF